jgi:hypothetical protein
MMRAIALFVVVCAVAAQDNTTTTGNEPEPSPGPMGPEYIAGMIQMEQYMASKFLDIILKFQHAQYQHYGSMFFLQAQMVEWQASQKAGGASDSEASSMSLEEEDEGVEDNQAAKFRLMGSYYLLNSVHVKLYQILVKAPEVQMEYYYNRAMQMSMMSLGAQLPPQMYQLIYLSAFNTHLKTLKLSYALQYVSHFRTWLEDEIDVNGALVEDAQGADLIAQEQEDDLLMDRTFAFNSYFHLAQIDYQTFMLDMYTQYMWAAVMAPQGQQQQQSFLETEETLGEQAQFMPFFGAGGNSMEMYSTWIRWYHIILQLTAAQSGQYSVQLEYFALHAEDQSNIDEDKISQASDFAFTSFASTLLQASQMQYWLAMLSMYSMYAPQQQQMAK